ncbi:MAG TPA: hypothetical protein DIT89_07285 [Planctomycetaceae bacterium]|nr:hypothetical protein [Planctomycetaceae bacterium]
MRFRRPVVLLLGGMLAASSLGCSAASALMGDYEPASSAKQASADRMVAIAQVFEQQGQLDKAESMYRGALKKNPQNAMVRQQLAEVQTKRRNGTSGTVVVHTVPPTRRMTPVAAGSATASGMVVLPAAGAAVAAPVTPAPAAKVSVPVTSATPAPAPATTAAPVVVSPAAVPVQKPASVAVPAVSTATPAAPAAAVPASTGQTPVPVRNVSTAEAIPAKSAAVAVAVATTLDALLQAADKPEDNTELLIQAVQQGESSEAKCLAMTLLGECSSENAGIREAIEKTVSDASTPTDVLLAAVDSQVQRGELTAASAERLIGVVKAGQTGDQVQAITMLRYFTAMDGRESCLSALETCLTSTDSEVRAAAALALGDFTPLPETQLAKLKELAEKDASQDVRDAAAASLKRTETATGN